MMVVVSHVYWSIVTRDSLVVSSTYTLIATVSPEGNCLSRSNTGSLVTGGITICVDNKPVTFSFHVNNKKM